MSSVVGTPQIGNLATLGYALTSIGTPTSVTNVVSIETDPKFGSVEVPLLGLTAKEFLPTVLEGGEPTFTCSYSGIDTTMMALLGYFLAGTMLFWTLTLPDGSMFKFAGFLTGAPLSGIEQETYIETEFTLKISGGITFTT